MKKLPFALIMPNPNNNQNVIYQATTSKCIYLAPAIILTGLLLYSIFSVSGKNILPVLIVGILCFIPAVIGSYGKKMVLARHKVYVYSFNRKVISWNIIDDFKTVEFRQNPIGKFLNFGTLLIVNKDNEFYEYYFVENPQKMYEQIVLRYEKLMKRLDPAFIPVYKREEQPQQQLDTITPQEEKNEIK